MFKFLTKLSNEKLRNWKLSIKLNLLLIAKLIYFSNSFGITFTLTLNLPSFCIIRWESYFFRLWNSIESLWFKIDIAISMCKTSIFSSDMTMISYFNITINIIIIANPTFSRVLKIFIIFSGHHKFFVKMFFFVTSLQYLLPSIILLIKL